FVQDDWKALPRLTLNLGLRYELNTVPIDNRNFLSVFSLSTLQFTRTNRPGFEGDHNNFGPRAGFSWDPFGNGKTAVRGGYGISFDQLVSEFMSALSNTPPLNFNRLANNTTLSAPLGAATAPAPNGVMIDHGLRTPYVQQFNFNIQQQVV